MKIVVSSGILFFLFIIASVGFVSKANTILLKKDFGGLEGVISCINGPALEGAIVSLGVPYIDTTDASGYYFMDNIVPGEYTMTISLDGLFIPPSQVLINEETVTVADVTLNCDGFTVEPDMIDLIVNPGTDTTLTLTLSNTGPLSVDWTANIEILNESIGEDFLDVQFQYPIGLGGNKGIECDGEYFYICSIGDGTISKYGLDGTFIEILSITFAGHDLAYNGTYFYGCQGSPTLYEMDFYNEVYISTLTIPGDVRAIAYNHDEDVFYGYNWGGDIIVFDLSGVLLGSAPVGPTNANYSGFAYDNVSDGAPYLWGYGISASDLNILVQLELPSLTETGLTVSLSALLPEPLTNVAGGLFSQPDIAGNTWTLGGVVTDEWLWGLELGPSEDWISIDPVSGTIPAGQSAEMTVPIHTSGLIPDNYDALISFSTDPFSGSPTVNVNLEVYGGYHPPGNFDVSISCVDLDLSWTVPYPQLADSFQVIINAEVFYTTDFGITISGPGIYWISVSAFYAGQQSPPSDELILEIPWPDDTEPTNLEAVFTDLYVDLYWDAPQACEEPDSYYIYANDELVGNTTETTYGYLLMPSVNYEIYVKAVYFFGESDPSNSVFVYLESITETVKNEIRMYPNPASDHIHLQLQTFPCTMKLLSPNGNPVYGKEIDHPACEIDVLEFKRGLYLLTVETETYRVVEKLILR